MIAGVTNVSQRYLRAKILIDEIVGRNTECCVERLSGQKHAESCGKCTPCRIGSTRGVELIDKITAGINRDANIEVLVDLCEVMADGSLCAMGGLTPLPVRSALKNFTEDFQG